MLKQSFPLLRQNTFQSQQIHISHFCPATSLAENPNTLYAKNKITFHCVCHHFLKLFSKLQTKILLLLLNLLSLLLSYQYTQKDTYGMYLHLRYGISKMHHYSCHWNKTQCKKENCHLLNYQCHYFHAQFLLEDLLGVLLTWNNMVLVGGMQ